MAKASKEEWKKVMEFSQQLEDEIKYREMSNEALGAWVRKAPPLMRVVFGYSVLVDNCCDENSDTLEWKPELLKKIEETK